MGKTKLSSSLTLFVEKTGCIIKHTDRQGDEKKKKSSGTVPGTKKQVAGGKKVITSDKKGKAIQGGPVILKSYVGRFRLEEMTAEISRRGARRALCPNQLA